MYCVKCGVENKDSNKYCDRCGTELKIEKKREDTNFDKLGERKLTESKSVEKKEEQGGEIKERKKYKRIMAIGIVAIILIIGTCVYFLHTISAQRSHYEHKYKQLQAQYEVLQEEYEILNQDCEKYIAEIALLGEAITDKKNIEEERQNDSATTSSNDDSREETLQSREGKTDIFTLKPFVGSLHSVAKESEDREDNMGNTYTGGYVLLIGKDHSITYFLNKEYSTLSTEIGLLDSLNNSDDSRWLEFYGDGVRLGETPFFKSGARPSVTEISIEGVEELEIRFCGPYRNIGGAINSLLTKGIFIE